MRFRDTRAAYTHDTRVSARNGAARLVKNLRVRVRPCAATPALPVMPGRSRGESLRRGGIFNDDDKGRQPFQTRSCKRLLSFHARRDRVALRALPFPQWLLFATELIRAAVTLGRARARTARRKRARVSIDLREKLATLGDGVSGWDDDCVSSSAIR